MARPWDDRQKDLMCPALDQIIDRGHPLVRLAEGIDWRFLDGRDSGEPIGDAQDRRHRDAGLQTPAVFAPRDDQAMPSDTSDAQQISVAALTSTMRRCDGQNYRQTRRRVRRPIRRIGPTAGPTAGNRSLSRIPWFSQFTRSTRWSLISPEPRLRLYSRSGAQEGRFRIAPSAEVTSLRHQVGGDLTNLLRGQVLRILVHDLVSPRR